MADRALKAICILVIIVVAVVLAVGIAIGLGGNRDEKPDDYDNFAGLQKFTIDDTIPVTLHKSSKTGLTLVHAEVVQPLVEGVICLRTEAFDNDGLPHTLEHLVFMGSKKYPYKGSLDMIANRCLASGTNAWTGLDQTCYTMMTAGSEGFLNLLPIFLDHVLNPTLNESFFVTEVYHVNGKGEDGGVVFNEMQGRAMDPDRVILFEAARLLFPGRCGYKYDTGGLVPNLRNSTNNRKIRAYHRKFYRPENIMVVVSGNVEKKALFDSIRQIEEEEEEKEREKFEKPFQKDCPSFQGTVDKLLQYPDEEEKFGRVNIYWRLEGIRDDYFKYLAHLEMMDYLSKGVSSPIQKTFVETSAPLATSVNFAHDMEVTSLMFSTVPIDRLNEIKSTFFELMANVTTTDFDLQRMRTILKATLTARASTLENYPSQLVLQNAIHSFLFDEEMEALKATTMEKECYERLLTEEEGFWKEVMKPYAGLENSVVLVAKPSKEAMKRKEEKDKAFIEERIAKLGVAGLGEKAEILREAKESNDAQQIPDQVLETIPIPSVNSIVLPEAVSVRSRRLHPDADSPEMLPERAAEVTDLIDVFESPFAIQISQYKSLFVKLQVFSHAGEMDPNLKRYLVIFSALVFKTDVIRDGVRISHQEVEQELDRDTEGAGTYFSTKTGLVNIEVNVQEKNFIKGLKTMREGLTMQSFTTERLQHFVTTFYNSFPAVMKSSYRMMDEVLSKMLLKNESNSRLTSPHVQYKTLKLVAADLENNEGNETLAKLQQIVDYITQPERMVFHIAGDIESIAASLKREGEDRDLAAILDEYLGVFRRKADPALTTVCLDYDPIKNFLLPMTPETTNVKVLSMSTEESSSMRLSTGLNIEVGHSDLPALRLISTFFNMMEGPLWKQIRGLGLAYGFDFSFSVLRGLVSFSASQASDVVQVYEEVKKFVDSLASEDGDSVNELTLQSAKSTLIFGLIYRSEKSQMIAQENMHNCFEGRPLNFTRETMEATWRVTPAEVKRVLRTRVQPLFNKGAVAMVVTTNPANADKVVEDFRQKGLQVEKIDVDKIDLDQM